jgi:hypothetical protein
MDMREAAETYCSLVESSTTSDERVLASRLLTALGDAVSAAMRLPDVEPSGEESPLAVSDAEWRARYQHLGRLTGSWAGHYWETSHPLAPDQAGAGVGVGDLVDDLTDVWRDLEDGLLALRAGSSTSDVEWQWRQDYWSHWGHHAVSAMRVLLLHLTGRGQQPPREA